MPDDRQVLLDRNPLAQAYFLGFPPSSREIVLEWIAKAKRPATRLRRLETTVALAAENIGANHPKPRTP
ncbi:uncharacterized protein YdeI (YjbR/CyaY-like superfamily) [Nakamurella sp. UYEF19]|uniref:YdeI/OmpD-associated family protein n=1 Tax=Nakamurella sp. UYEF19 TaxID=1756392 RepID=UPI003393902F